MGTEFTTVVGRYRTDCVPMQCVERFAAQRIAIFRVQKPENTPFLPSENRFSRPSRACVFVPAKLAVLTKMCKRSGTRSTSIRLKKCNNPSFIRLKKCNVGLLVPSKKCDSSSAKLKILTQKEFNQSSAYS